MKELINSSDERLLKKVRVEGWASLGYTIEIDHFEDFGTFCAQIGAQDESFTNDTPTKIGCPSGWRERGVCIILCNIPKINTKCVECVELQTWVLSRKKSVLCSETKIFQSVEKR